MALELKQNLKLSQDLVITPQLRQAIELLAMNRMEVAELVNKEMTENPVLEDGQDSTDVEQQKELESSNQNPEGEQARDEDAFTSPEKKTEDLPENPKDDFNWESYIDDFNNNYSSAPSMKEVNEDLPSFESALSKTSTLEDHIAWQLSMTTMAEEEEKLGELIIGNLNTDGYLAAELEDLAKEAKVELEDAEEFLKMIQNLDPVGVASRNLQECLLIQAKFMEPRQPLVEKIIAEHLKELEKKDYGTIAKKLQITMEDVITAVKLILEFEPKPGRSFHTAGTQYITPDVYVYKVGGEFMIVLNEDGLPKLRISSYYKDILSGKGGENEGAKGTKAYVQDKLRSAMWLIRSIHRRQSTIYKVTETIVNRQREFFEKGVQHLRPMILKDVANEIGMHESTISRVTTNKFVHTPVGIFELKYFFNAGIKAADGSEALASKAVKDKIKGLVAKEDPKHPLSDQKIVDLLKKDNINIARRTVAKYREMMNILPSGKRKKVF